MPKTKKKAERKEIQGCLICERERVSEKYCNYHEMAYKNVLKAHADWQEGYGELSFEDYLIKIIENSATGVWAKEIAESLIKKEDSKK
ncbi:MAG: hypothetical protein ACFFD2_26895 [Promethearchaeota archaeon]